MIIWRIRERLSETILRTLFCNAAVLCVSDIYCDVLTGSCRFRFLCDCEFFCIIFLTSASLLVLGLFFCVFVYLVSFLVLSLVLSSLSSSAVDLLERLVSDMTCYVSSSKTLNIAYSLTY